MGWIADLMRYRDDRHELGQLWHQIDRLGEEFDRRTEGLCKQSEDYRQQIEVYYYELDTLLAGIAQLETRRMIHRAGRWRVPIPQKPRKKEQNDDFWEWHRLHGQYYLSEDGASKLRKEIFQESEMFWKPWLSWGAIAISIVSLAVVIFRP